MIDFNIEHDILLELKRKTPVYVDNVTEKYRRPNMDFVTNNCNHNKFKFQAYDDSKKKKIFNLFL